MINTLVKIKDVITEDFAQPEHFVSGNQIDPELMALKKRAKQIEDGLDPDRAEIVQDFPI